MTIIARSALLTTAALLIAGCGNEGTTGDSGSAASVGGSNASANSSTTGGNKASTTKRATSNATKAAGGTSSVDTEDSGGQGGATSEETGSEGGSASTDPVDAQGGSTAEETAAGGTSSRRTTRTSKASGGSTSSSASKANGGATSTTKATGGATSNTVSTKSTGGASTATTTRAVGGTSASTTTASTTAPTNSNLEKFSFFVTSYAAMVRLSGNNSGFGGKLDYDGSTGIDGADKICAAIAEASMQGASAKGWKAFLSTSKVNAIDRITYEGPFYDRRGRQVASSKLGLIATRPTGADSAIANDLPNEDGTPNHNPDGTQVDNHDVLTGSNAQGKATGYQCEDWKDNTKSGQIQIGHSWPAHGDNWITAHSVSGCKPGVTFLNNPNAEGGPQGTVGSMGGYGAIYCLASQP